MRTLASRLKLILLVFAALALIAGALLFVGATRTDDYFSWTIEPPLTAAALGGFYWAAFVLIGAAALSKTWAEARPAVLPVALIAVLLLVITLVHLDRFDLDSLFGVFWLAAYTAVPLLLAWGLIDQARRPGEDARGERRLPGALRWALLIEGGAMLATGAVMLVSPATAADIWPWALTPLTSRAIGSFLAGIGVAALIAVRDDDPLRFRGAALAYLALGLLELLAVGLHEPDLGDDDLATTVFLGFWAAVMVTGAYGSSVARASAGS